MMNIDEIKTFLKSGDIAGAEAAAKELLTADPDNVQAMMLYGTSRQLQGDEATFRRIHGELVPKMAKIADDETQEMWRKFDGMNRDASTPLLVAEGPYPDGDVCTLYGCDEFRELEVYGCASFEALRRIEALRRTSQKKQRFYSCVVFIIVTLLACWLAWWLG